MNQRELIDYIKYTRKLQGLTQLDMAEHLGITRPQVANIEGGRYNCSLSKFLAMCELLSIRLSDFDGEVNKQYIMAKKRLEEINNRKLGILTLKKEILELEHNDSIGEKSE